MNNLTNIHRGVWAGHAFDIMTERQHLQEVGKTEEREEWRDVSEEVAREVEIIWEGEFGKTWMMAAMR